MEFASSIVAYFVLLLFAILGLATFFVEKLWIPFRKSQRDRRELSDLNSDTAAARYDSDRDQLIQKKQEELTETASDKEQEKLEKEIEKKMWILEDKIKRLGIDTGQGLGTPLEDNRLKRRALTQMEEARRIREEQDREYEQSLRQDQLKDQKMWEKHQAAITKKKRRKERMMKLQLNLPIPPKDLTQGVCSIVVRIPNGERIERRFYSNATVQNLIDFAEAMSDFDSKDFQLVTSIPRKIYSDTEMTLESAGLIPKAVLILEMKS